MVWNRAAQKVYAKLERIYNERLRNRAHVLGSEHRKNSRPASRHKVGSPVSNDRPYGNVEHAVFVVPKLSEGYTTDDNARALIVQRSSKILGVRVPVGSAKTWLPGTWPSYACF